MDILALRAQNPQQPRSTVSMPITKFLPLCNTQSSQNPSPLLLSNDPPPNSFPSLSLLHRHSSPINSLPNSFITPYPPVVNTLIPPLLLYPNVFNMLSLVGYVT